METSVQRKMRRNPPLPNFNSSPKKQKVANSLSGETQGKEDLASIKSGTAKMKKIIRKGKAPVDEHCGLSESCHVLEEGQFLQVLQVFDHFVSSFAYILHIRRHCI